MTGSTPRGGGLWKYLLRDFMKRDTPMLSQVLHFLDFPVNGKTLAKWRHKTICEWYQDVNGPYNAPLFLDSGGFKLLYNTGLDLTEFGIEKETEADDILALQEDFGGEIFASLDYPLTAGARALRSRETDEPQLGKRLPRGNSALSQSTTGVFVRLLPWTVPIGY